MTTDKNNAAPDPQPAELNEVSGDSGELPPLPPVDGYDKRVQGHYSAEQMRDYARNAIRSAKQEQACSGMGIDKMAKELLERHTVAVPVAVEDGRCFMVREQDALDAIRAALAATGKQQVGEAVTDRMVEAALQSTVAEPNVGTPWREMVALDEHADFIEDMRKAIQAAISAQPDTPDFSPATQAVADHCDRIFWRHNYYTLPLGPSDRAKPTRRRQSAVELVQKLGFQWKDEAWVQVGEVQGDAGFDNRMGSADFEVWAKAEGYSLHRDPSSGNYTGDTLHAWRAWRHLAARQPGAQVRDHVPQEVVSAISAVAVIAHKESRHHVQKHIDTINAWLYAAPPAQGIDLGKFRALAEDLIAADRFDDYSLDMETVAVSAGRRLLALIDGQRDAAPGVES